MKSIKLSSLILITIIVAALCIHLSAYAYSHHGEVLEGNGKRDALQVEMPCCQQPDFWQDKQSLSFDSSGNQ